MLEAGQPSQGVQERGRFQVERAVDVVLQGACVDSSDRRVQGSQVVDLRVPVEELGGVEKEGDVERVLWFGLGLRFPRCAGGADQLVRAG
ncbi:hypothetical protein GCM10010277_82540 [Streptomyces longisporoflavus]|nr:hypothetical protein GCM10010277_82540 [Streptomyces longisporoflavus]